ncbi:MAG: Asp-tRNA(Asn)/Glu-tRNA(Gln) amidotransferase subunit GatC [bacterium]
MDRGVIRYIADLSNISLAPDEEEMLTKELTRIIEYISKINEVLEDVLPPLEQRETLMRPDEVKPGLSSILGISKYIEDNQFKVPKVIR